MLRSFPAAFVLLTALVIAGCDSSPKLPDNAQRVFYGPILKLPVNDLVDRPGTFYAVKGSAGKVVGVAHVVGTGGKFGFPIRNLDAEGTYSVFFVADEDAAAPPVAQPKEEGK